MWWYSTWVQWAWAWLYLARCLFFQELCVRLQPLSIQCGGEVENQWQCAERHSSRELDRQLSWFKNSTRELGRRTSQYKRVLLSAFILWRFWCQSKTLKRVESKLADQEEEKVWQVRMVEEECGSLELEEEKVEVTTAEKAEKPAPKKWVARPLTTVRAFICQGVLGFLRNSVDPLMYLG